MSTGITPPHTHTPKETEALRPGDLSKLRGATLSWGSNPDSGVVETTGAGHARQVVKALAGLWWPRRPRAHPSPRSQHPTRGLAHRGPQTRHPESDAGPTRSSIPLPPHGPTLAISYLSQVLPTSMHHLGSALRLELSSLSFPQFELLARFQGPAQTSSLPSRCFPVAHLHVIIIPTGA